MKHLFIGILSLLIYTSFSQTPLTEYHKTELLVKVWGLVKYQHPEVSKGTFDMNTEFLTELEKIQEIDLQDDLNSELLNWIRHFDVGKSKFKIDSNRLLSKNIFTQNAHFDWIDHSGFNTELVTLLKQIQNNSAIGDHYATINGMNKMLELRNENGLDDFDAEKKAHRLLFLSSFWNQMNYWNVNLYLTQQPWSSTLTEMIPEFCKNDVTQFECAKDKLFAKLNDSHSDYKHNATSKKMKKFAFVGGKIINDSLTITKLFNKELAAQENIQLGDVIVSIEGKKVKDYYTDKFYNSFSASNDNYLRAIVEGFSYILSSERDSILSVEIINKNREKVRKQLTLDLPENYKYEGYKGLIKPNPEVSYKLNDDIGYLNLEKITNSEVKKAFIEFKNTKGIIIDLRNYPQNRVTSELTNFLYPNKQTYIKILAPLYPGYGEYDIDAALKIIKNPFAAGKKNNDYYNGKVVLLVDRTTASNAEFIAMSIQQSPNCITLGEQTFGAPLNRNRVPLIDKTSIDFTGQGAFYPNDIGVQGKGLKIDYLVKESALHYNPNAYIEQAIKLIEQTDSQHIPNK